MNETEVQLVYDAECPACNTYCKSVRIDSSVGRLQLVDAREPSNVLEEATRRGWDIDQGMVLKVGGELYYGVDAINLLAQSSSRSTVFNRLNYRIFRSSRVSKTLYPLLRSCRNLLLKLMRKTKINNLDMPKNQRF